MQIVLSDIAVIRRQRRQMDMSKLQALANDILATEAFRGEGHGLIHPINVRPTRPDDTYPDDFNIPDLRGQPVREPWILVTGGRRTAAHTLIGRDRIEAINWADLPPLEQRVVELSENINREDISWQERLAAQAEIHEIRTGQAVARGEQHTQRDTGDELGVSHAAVSRDLALHKLIKADPSLAKAPTKKAALRKADFKTEIKRRVDAIKSVDVTDLRRRLVTADMRDYIRSVDSNSIDLHFSDFPFGIDYDKVRPDNETQKGIYRDDPDAIRDLLADVVLEMVRTVKPGGWIAAMMGWSNYQFLAGLFRTACKTHHAYAPPTYSEDGSIVRKVDKCSEGNKSSAPCVFLEPEALPWVWYRPNSRNPSLWPELHANNQFELICVVNGGEARLARANVPNVLMFDAEYKDRIHEMQRPHDFCKEIISRFTVTGERVMDLCFGSGAHLAAAADMARDFLGCDISPDNLGPALSLVAQYYKGDASFKALRSPAQTIKERALAEAAETEAELLALSDEEAESVGL